MKIAIITGASSGMGRRMAIELNDTIPNIEAFWLFGRRVERLEALEKQLTKPCRFFTDDLQTSAARDTLQRALAEEAPEIVFLVNAAGFGQIGTIRGLSLEDQLGMVDLNIGALTAITRLCLPFMAPKSRILNFASSAAFLPQPNFAELQPEPRRRAQDDRHPCHRRLPWPGENRVFRARRDQRPHPVL